MMINSQRLIAGCGSCMTQSFLSTVSPFFQLLTYQQVISFLGMLFLRNTLVINACFDAVFSETNIYDLYFLCITQSEEDNSCVLILGNILDLFYAREM